MGDPEEKMDQPEERVGLKRELGLFSAIMMIVAVMIGSGIFVSPASALARSGSVGLALIVWISCGVLSLIGALAFAELTAVVPRSGAEYAYLSDAFGPLHPWLGPVPAFLCSWIYVFVLRPAEVAVINLTFAEYLVVTFRAVTGDLNPEDIEKTKKLIAIMALGLMVYINTTSVKLYLRVQNVFTICKVAACILVIGGGIWWLSTGHTELLHDPFEGTTKSPAKVALAFYSGLWAYDGWSSAALVAEEVKRPEVNILRSILVAIPLVTVLYCTMNVAYMSALTKTEMTQAAAVAELWAEKVLPDWLGLAIPFGVALSTFGCGLSLQFGVARLCYVAGREGHVPRFFSWIHVTRMTPAAAVALQGVLTLICISRGSIVALIEFASFLTWVFYGLAMVALLVMRRTKADMPRTYRVPTVVPWLVLGIAIFLAVAPIVSEPSMEYLFVLLFMLFGLVVYHFYVYEHRQSDFSRNLTHLIQMLFMVVPPDEGQSKSQESIGTSEEPVKVQPVPEKQAAVAN